MAVPYYGEKPPGSGIIAPTDFGLWGDSDVGPGVIGTSDTQAGVDGTSNTIYGVRGRSFGSRVAGVYGSSNDSESSGVQGESVAGVGVYGHSASEGFFGVSEANPGVLGINDTSRGYGVVGATKGGLASSGVAGASAAGTGVRGVSGTGWGVIGQCDESIGVLGINLVSPSSSVHVRGVMGFSEIGTGVYGETRNETNSPSVPGVHGVCGLGPGVIGDSTNGSGVQGLTTNGPGVEGASSSGPGVRGGPITVQRDTGTVDFAPLIGVHGIGTNIGVLGRSDNAFEIAVGVRGEGGPGVTDFPGFSRASVGVLGTTESDNGDAAGVFGSNPQGGAGVWGLSGNGAGVHGESPNGIGVSGRGNNFAGFFDGNVIVTGLLTATSSVEASSPRIGVHSTTPRQSDVYLWNRTQWAGLFDGDVQINGDVAIRGKESVAGLSFFQIDHPLDPANKYLNHHPVESSEMKNAYDGVAVLDETGEAAVQLPKWFEALNKDFRYQLTPIGAPGPDLYVAEKISNNQFKIAGGEPGMEVSWHVTGIRKHKGAEIDHIPVEEEKPEGERGLFLFPEAHDEPEERGLGWVRREDAMQRIEEAGRHIQGHLGRTEENERRTAERQRIEERQSQMEEYHRQEEERLQRMAEEVRHTRPEEYRRSIEEHLQRSRVWLERVMDLRRE